MTKLRTSEDIKLLLLQTKQRQQKKQQQLQRQQEQQQEEERKRETMEHLYILASKIKKEKQQRKYQEEKKQIKRYHQLIENDREIYVYKTIDQLKQWEHENYQCINWQVWDSLIKITREINNINHEKEE